MITVRVGRLDESETEALLCPVRSDFSGLTSAGRRVETGAGEKVRARLEGMGELPVGGAVVTPGGDLRVPFIIHAVVESREESMTPMGIQRAVLNGLRRAREWEVASLSLPPVGLGVGTMDADASAEMVVALLRDHLQEGEPPAELVIVVESSFEEDLFRRLLAAEEHA